MNIKGMRTLVGELKMKKNWVNMIRLVIQDELENAEKLSDAVMESIYVHKADSFGDEDYTISEYEKKLFCMGILLGGMLDVIDEAEFTRRRRKLR